MSIENQKLKEELAKTKAMVEKLREEAVPAIIEPVKELHDLGEKIRKFRGYGTNNSFKLENFEYKFANEGQNCNSRTYEFKIDDYCICVIYSQKLKKNKVYDFYVEVYKEDVEKRTLAFRGVCSSNGKDNFVRLFRQDLLTVENFKELHNTVKESLENELMKYELKDLYEKFAIGPGNPELKKTGRNSG